MSDGVPVKKRWKIDFSSMCNKSVVSFSKATAGGISKADGAADQPDSADEALQAVTLDGAETAADELLETAEASAGSPLEAEAELQPEVQWEPATAADPEPAVHGGPEVKAELQSEPEAELQGAAEPQSDAGAALVSEAASAPAADPDFQPAVEPQPERVPEPKPEPEEPKPRSPAQTKRSPTKVKLDDFDLDPSSPPLMVSKPADMKRQPKVLKVTKKKKVLVTIQTYNSASEEEEPEKKVRPQRRSKPSMMDLRDQHRIFNTTSFVKERSAPPEDVCEPESRPEPVVHPAPAPVPPAPAPVPTPAAVVSLVEAAPAAQTRSLTSSSDDTEDGLPLSQLVTRKNVPPPPEKEEEEEEEEDSGKLLRKVKKKKLKKKKKDPQEPQKPVSAYALFFREMQSGIKAERPEASFGEISKIVANQWDALENQKKTDYKKKTEMAKKEYLKRLAAYKANKISAEPFLEAAPAAPEPVPVSAAPPGFAPAKKTLGGHLYSAQQSQQAPAPQQQQMAEGPAQPRRGHVQMDFAAQDGPAAGDYQPTPRISSISTVLPSKPGICVNDGCTNLAIEDHRWDREYCSTECVVQHCRDAFQSWVLQRQDCAVDSGPIY